MKYKTLIVGIFTVLGLALIYVTYTSLTQSDGLRPRSGYQIEAQFEDLLLLRVNDDVRMSGVRIGVVERLGLRGQTAFAIFRIEEAYQIPRDSVATISMAGLLGTNYISITMGDDRENFYTAGDVIRTRPGSDVNTIIGEIGEIGMKLGDFFGEIGEMFGDDENILMEFVDFFRENRENLTATVSNIRDISAKINEGEGTLARLVNDPSLFDEAVALAGDIRKISEEADALLKDVRGAVAAIQEGEGTIGKLLFDEEMATNVGNLVANLESFSAKLNDPDSTVGRLLSDDAILRDFQMLIQKANQTLDGLSDGAPISAVGAAATALF